MLNYVKNMCQEGWRCPQCGKIYSPFVQECYHCNAKQTEDTYKSTWICNWTYEDSQTDKK